MYFEINKAEYKGDFKINLFFENGKNGVLDFKPLLIKYNYNILLNNAEVFKNFKNEFGTIIWENEDIDFSPELLYLQVTGEKNILWNNSEKTYNQAI